MSRSGYIDEIDDWQMIKWRGQVASAIRGRRGQRFLTDLYNALEALPEKRLIQHELKDETGEVCAIGALGMARNIDMEKIDPTRRSLSKSPERSTLRHNLLRKSFT